MDLEQMNDEQIEAEAKKMVITRIMMVMTNDLLRNI